MSGFQDALLRFSRTKPIKPLADAWRWLSPRISQKRTISGQSLNLPKELLPLYPLGKTHDLEVEAFQSLKHISQRDNLVLWDIGANVGFLSVAMSRLAGPSGSVVAFEPNPRTVRTLQAMLALNACTNVDIQSCAVGDSNGSISFYLSSLGGVDACSSIRPDTPLGEKVEVQSITADSFLVGHRPPNYIKIDVEGAELGVLRGAQRLLSEIRPIIQVEVHGEYLQELGDSVEGVFSLLSGMNYQILNCASWEEVSASEFLEDTLCRAVHPVTGEDVSKKGYGHILAVPR